MIYHNTNFVWNIYSATTFNLQEGKWQAQTLCVFVWQCVYVSVCEREAVSSMTHYVAPMCHLLTGDTQHLSGFATLK